LRMRVRVCMSVCAVRLYDPVRACVRVGVLGRARVRAYAILWRSACV
jgi:hypothetical protein